MIVLYLCLECRAQMLHDKAIPLLTAGKSTEAATLLASLIHSKDSSERDAAQALYLLYLYENCHWQQILQQPHGVNIDGSIKVMAQTLAQAPPFSCSFSGKTSVVPVNLRYASENPYISLQANGKKIKGIFDTGAGISLISESMARKLGVKPLPGGASTATSASLKSVNMHVAVIDSVRFGNAVFHYLPVGIVDDAMLEFKQWGIKVVDINFILGWHAIRELDITMNYVAEKILIRQPDMSKPVNNGNCFWAGIPIVSINLNNQQALAELDLGGNATNLLPDYLHSGADTLGIQYFDGSFGGAGGFNTFRGFRCSRISFAIGEYTCYFKALGSRPDDGRMVPPPLKPVMVLGGQVGEQYQLHFCGKQGFFRLEPLP